MIDSTNLSHDYVRNRVRLEIVPVLRGINPNVQEAARRCMDTLSADDVLLERLASQSLQKLKKENGYQAAELLAQDKALRTRVIAQILRDEGCAQPAYCHIASVEQLLAHGKGCVQVGGGVTARVRRGVLEFPQEDAVAQTPPLAVQPLEWPKHRFLHGQEGGWLFSFVYKKDFVKIQKIPKHQLANCLDYDRIHGNLILRQRIAGDCLRPAGRGCTKTFKNLFQELEVPPEKRSGCLF